MSTAKRGTNTRRQQIIEAALQTIERHGVQGATISRIAEAAGITSGALYSHFENRKAILVAALDEVYAQVFESFSSSRNDDPRMRIREICEHHARKLADTSRSSHARLFLEFVAFAHDEGLKESLRDKEREAISYLTSIFRRFEQRGQLSPSADPEMIAWMIATWAWTGDVAHLADLGSVWHTGLSSRLLDLITASLCGNGSGTAPAADRVPPVADTQPETVNAPPLETCRSCGYPNHFGLPVEAAFTLSEVANLFKVSPVVAREMVETGQIISVRIGDEQRIPRWALIAYLRANTSLSAEGARG